ncbi:hypothetical protein GCM10011512_14910 [Tersicoccus solisilvae]|uniref:DUF3040 domain-containing protein n=1 Tax=Tersicoccus solisilvae TaxID=1882339 RepID=A0ABQ1P182_9MICC|nr:HGxxPAAW family protein [Tersicoccus solisilvae]GGC89025.1 hypothetical protein GCM10011512_14910 [Tersicoccus solisilvae]
MSTGTQQGQHEDQPVGDEANAPDRKADLLPVGHGNSPAAWTCVGVMALGVLVGCVAFVFANVPFFVVGVVIIALGLVAGWVLRRAGYGVGGDKVKSHHA